MLLGKLAQCEPGVINSVAFGNPRPQNERDLSDALFGAFMPPLQSLTSSDLARNEFPVLVMLDCWCSEFGVAQCRHCQSTQLRRHYY
jgi:hypothetical protein